MSNPAVNGNYRPGRRLAGFTMVELIAVIVIMGILAAVAGPRFFDRGTFDSREFYDQVISTLRYAQKEAIAQHRYVCVSFPANNSITLTFGTTAACVDGTLTSPSGTPYPLVSSHASFAGVTPSPLNFNALGQPSIAATQTINISGYTVAPITIEMETGYVH